MTAACETEPAAASALAGDRIDLLRSFTRNLAKHGETLGLIGPLELPRLWTRHVLNSALVAPLLGPGTVADVGSGAGLPGIVLACLRPDLEFVLIEPMERRCQWLNAQREELGLSNVRVERARAEDLPAGLGVDTVTARAVSALRTLLPLTAPLLRPGGELVLLKGASVEQEISSAEKAIRKYRLSDVRVEILGEGVLSESTRVFRATVGAADARARA